MSKIIAPVRPLGSKIVGIGGYRPKQIVTNDEIAPLIDSSDQWIRERSGIIHRRFANDEETVAEMAARATLKALKNAAIDPAQVDLLILATATNPAQLPNLAMEVAHKIGATNAGAYDLGAACSGFSYGLATASEAVLAGDSKVAVIVGSERMSDFVSQYDRGTAFLFGDGAGAFVVTSSEEFAIASPVWGADGSMAESICMTQSWTQFQAESASEFPSLKMEGQKVFRWAITEMVKVAQAAIAKAGITLDDLNAFVPHQANQRITDHIAKSLNLPEHVAIAKDGIQMGNTTAATIPLALETLIENKEVKSGDLALVMGFGAGLSYSGQVIVIP
jgi:3-oxoacyl-[acyl-carrier-protein] synthase-3